MITYGIDIGTKNFSIRSSSGLSLLIDFAKHTSSQSLIKCIYLICENYIFPFKHQIKTIGIEKQIRLSTSNCIIQHILETILTVSGITYILVNAKQKYKNHGGKIVKRNLSKIYHFDLSNTQRVVIDKEFIISTSDYLGPKFDDLIDAQLVCNIAESSL